MAAEDIDVILVQMLVSSGRTDDSQYFDYRPGFFNDIVRIEWELDTMEAVIESTAADYLIKHGYAKRLTPLPAEPPLVQLTEEPLVVEMPASPASSSVPSADEAPAVPPTPSPEPSNAPPAEANKETASSGGKRKQKEQRK